MPRCSASSTPCCCATCPIRMPAAWCEWSNRATTGRCGSHGRTTWTGAPWRVSGLRSLVRFRESAQVTAGLAYGRFSRVVVTLQFCLACGLLLVTAMFVKAGLQLGDVDFRFDAARTLGATLILDGSHDLPDRLARMQFGDDLRARLRTLPAVNGVTFSSRHPADQGMGGPVEAEGDPPPAGTPRRGRSRKRSHQASSARSAFGCRPVASSVTWRRRERGHRWW